MTLLFRVLYAVHAKGTHHKLALDAVRFLTVGDAEGWQRLVLKHAETYMVGAKAPDTEFKDFKNHVLHPRDNYWGGAPDAVEQWYGNLVAALKAESWEEAVRAAGVLSHYLSDPLHPFHTAQSEAENAIHAAFEWSVNRAYDQLWREEPGDNGGAAIAVGQGEGWLRELVVRGAEKANVHYEKLIAHYSIEAGVVDPPSGLDPVARRTVSELLHTAARTIAVVLDRAILEAGVKPPEVALALDTLLVTLAIPKQMLLKRIGDAEDRRQVELMYDELKATGRVVYNLPLDDRTVRDLHAREVVAPREAAKAAARSLCIASGGRPAVAAQADIAEATVEVVRATRPEAGLSSLTPRPASPRTAMAGESAQPPPLPPMARAGANDGPEDAVLAAAAAASRPREVRIYLEPADDIEKAPAIGPKTASRLAEAGVRTVAELLDADADSLAARLGRSDTTGDTVRRWQEQARLVCSVPGLRGMQSQLLVGAGYRTLESIAAADADKLCADVLSYSTTSEGQRILRDTAPPDIARIKLWAEAARTARAA